MGLDAGFGIVFGVSLGTKCKESQKELLAVGIDMEEENFEYGEDCGIIVPGTKYFIYYGGSLSDKTMEQFIAIKVVDHSLNLRCRDKIESIDFDSVIKPSETEIKEFNDFLAKSGINKTLKTYIIGYVSC